MTTASASSPGDNPPGLTEVEAPGGWRIRLTRPPTQFVVSSAIALGNEQGLSLERINELNEKCSQQWL